MSASVRPERPDDFAAVRLVIERAFGQPQEADLVEALRGADLPHVSLVAEVEGRVVGHVLFSPVTLEPPNPAIRGFGLAPLAVLPEYQRQGHGARLVRAGLEACRALAQDYVVVLGHPDYYARFGFRPASGFGLRCEYPVPEEVFLVLELRAGALASVAALVRYRGEFGCL